jgi:hypothetical protein
LVGKKFKGTYEFSVIRAGLGNGEGTYQGWVFVVKEVFNSLRPDLRVRGGAVG